MPPHHLLSVVLFSVVIHSDLEKDWQPTSGNDNVNLIDVLGELSVHAHGFDICRSQKLGLSVGVLRLVSGA